MIYVCIPSILLDTRHSLYRIRPPPAETLDQIQNKSLPNKVDVSCGCGISPSNS